MPEVALREHKIICSRTRKRDLVAIRYIKRGCRRYQAPEVHRSTGRPVRVKVPQSMLMRPPAGLGGWCALRLRLGCWRCGWCCLPLLYGAAQLHPFFTGFAVGPAVTFNPAYDMDLLAFAASVGKPLAIFAPDLQLDPISFTAVALLGSRPVNADPCIAHAVATFKKSHLWITAQAADEMMDACPKQDFCKLVHVDRCCCFCFLALLSNNWLESSKAFTSSMGYKIREPTWPTRTNGGPLPALRQFANV